MTRPRDEEALRGRGASWNPANRFDGVDYMPDPEGDCAPEECPGPDTQYLDDDSKSILARNDSPDVGFDVSVNPYRGCEHGCIYCYARPTHEYAGFSAGLDFETRILVKHRAPELLRTALAAPGWQPQVIAMCGVTDCYQPVERKLHLTRRCLEVLAEFRNPVVIITKNRLVTRDVDVLRALAAYEAVAVCVSLTTLDLELNRKLEPRTSSPAQRLETIQTLAAAGIPVRVLVAPVIPAITDHEMPRLLEAACRAGARHAGYVMLRLPYAVAPLFERWLEQHYPQRKDKVLNRLRSLRGGGLYKAEFGERMRGSGAFAEQVASVFKVSCKKLGMNEQPAELSTEHFRRPGAEQLTLF
ncbi:MAG: PA0069 family radical SAM protein [Candidatus Hydrogenedentes bacterium]|nr:PA0069 family radical SAM protein [Candidatus Hydrogenedentota bacterium]